MINKKITIKERQETYKTFPLSYYEKLFLREVRNDLRKDQLKPILIRCFKFSSWYELLKSYKEQYIHYLPLIFHEYD